MKIIALCLFFVSFTVNLFAACSADIDLGGYKIKNVTMSDDATLSEVATKSYVDALSSNGLKYATTCVRHTTSSTWVNAASQCASNKSWLPRSVLEAQLAGCNDVKGWVSFEMPTGDILVTTSKVSGDDLAAVYLINSGGYEIRGSTSKSQYNCVK
jgi:hypothetical protein